ncbi:Uncharacterised protein [Enterobacter hormaechei]|nr:Uncharacterised protein [Enterobacter hormaechei]
MPYEVVFQAKIGEVYHHFLISEPQKLTYFGRRIRNTIFLYGLTLFSLFPEQEYS